MALSLTGRNYIVTGGASGIGLATVHRLLKASATVHIIDKAHEMPKLQTSTGKFYVYLHVDVASRQEINETFKSVFIRSPVIHGLVNAAGISPSGNYDVGGEGYGIEKDSTFDRVMDINVRGTWNTTTELLRHSLSYEGTTTPSLSVVNIGSLASIKGYPTMAAYCASKHAVLGLTRTWAIEYGRIGHRFNLIAPGLIGTPLGLSAFGTDDERGRSIKPLSDLCAMGRLGEPDEIAGPIGFLLSDDSSFITGEAIAVSGGH